MICICFLIMPYLTFVWWWVVDCKIEFSKYYQMMAILVKGEWIPEVITKFSWEEMIRSIQDTDFPWMQVGSLITCCSPNWQVTASVLERSKVVVSPVYKLLNFALKLSMATIERFRNKKRISCRNNVQS